MKGFLLAGRVAVVFNILFLVCLVLRLFPLPADGIFTGLILIGGWILSVPANILWILWLLFLTLQHKKLPDVPRFLVVGIPAFFLFQLIYFFY